MLAFCPFLVLYFWMACDSFACSVVDPIVFVQKHSLAALVEAYFPKPTLDGFRLYFAWLFFQAFLYVFLPGPVGYGQMTPAGHKLPYIVNGKTYIALELARQVVSEADLYQTNCKSQIISDSIHYENSTVKD